MFTSAKIYFARQNVSAQHVLSQCLPNPLLDLHFVLSHSIVMIIDHGIVMIMAYEGYRLRKLHRTKMTNDLYIIIHDDRNGDYQSYKLIYGCFPFVVSFLFICPYFSII